MEKLISLIPQSLKAQSGSVFYSGKEAFQGEKKMYILGINPGGNPERQQAETIDWHTNKVMAMTSGWSAYLDESWRSKPPGTSRLQKRLLHLLKILGLHPHEVPASNVIEILK